MNATLSKALSAAAHAQLQRADRWTAMVQAHGRHCLGFAAYVAGRAA